MPMACANQLLEKLESTRELPTIPAVLVPLLRYMERPGQPNETRARQYVFNPRADQGCEPHVEVRFCTSPRPAEARAISEAGVRRARTAATYSRCFSASPFAAISVPREYLQGTSGSTGNRGARNFHRRTTGAAGYLAAVTCESARRNARGATHAARFHRPFAERLDHLSKVKVKEAQQGEVLQPREINATFVRQDRITKQQVDRLHPAEEEFLGDCGAF